MDIKFSKKIEKGFNRKVDLKLSGIRKESIVKAVKKGVNNGQDTEISKWNYIFPFILIAITFILIISALVRLQIIEGEALYARSVSNRYEVEYISPYRGIIFDRNGKKLVQNTPSVNLYIDLSKYRDLVGNIKRDEISELSDDIEKVLGKREQIVDPNTKKEVKLSQRVLSLYDLIDERNRYYTRDLLILNEVSNDSVVAIKAKQDTLLGVKVDNGSEREYIAGNAFSHILGYTGIVFAEDLESKNYISATDVIGKSGIESIYDERLFGTKGQIAREIDSSGKVVGEQELTLQGTRSGDSLYLTIDRDAQNSMYKILAQAVKKYGANGAAGIVQDVKTGEILVLASYPSYDNNMFIGGISQKEFDKLLNNIKTPLINKAIAAQVPPGSTFKTIVAASMLDAGVISPNTQYLSRSDYTFSDGTEFQEFGDKAYGWLNLNDAISVSSNIYFCEAVRKWDMNELVPYLESFGIGRFTGIDLDGEGPGRLPSPENKLKLARSGAFWLDDVWYPEGDSCNSVIGQGIATVTPLQMVNWTSAIANGGNLPQPHLAKKFVDADGNEDIIEYSNIEENIVKQSALKAVREGMWATVNGPRRVVGILSGADVTVAAKTGTAEFGRVNSDGVYEHTHAWVTGFFPYEDPKYAFTILLEDGGESYNAATTAREYIDWLYSR